mmetsp:Transcript_91485/g.237109  ORF Transcript_91485/g.237109 Transcript_91485/m.237109 type:complete len:473 (-) Transcript_91485:12-1430(-)
MRSTSTANQLPDQLNLEAFCELNFLELLLLEHKGELGEEDREADGTICVDAVHVLQHHLLLGLAEAAHVWVRRDGIVLLHLLASLNHDLGAWQDLLLESAAILLLDRHLEAVNRSDRPGLLGKELVVVALVALRVDLATAAVATEVKELLAEVDVLACVRVRGEDRESHRLIALAGHRASHNNVRLLLAVRCPREALHLLLQRLGQPVLGSELPALRHDGDGARVHRRLGAVRNRLIPLVVLGRNFNGGLEDCIRKHLLGQADVNLFTGKVAIRTCDFASWVPRFLIVLLGEDRVGLHRSRHGRSEDHTRHCSTDELFRGNLQFFDVLVRVLDAGSINLRELCVASDEAIAHESSWLGRGHGGRERDHPCLLDCCRVALGPASVCLERSSADPRRGKCGACGCHTPPTASTILNRPRCQKTLLATNVDTGCRDLALGGGGRERGGPGEGKHGVWQYSEQRSRAHSQISNQSA